MEEKDSMYQGFHINLDRSVQSRETDIFLPPDLYLFKTATSTPLSAESPRMR